VIAPAIALARNGFPSPTACASSTSTASRRCRSDFVKNGAEARGSIFRAIAFRTWVRCCATKRFARTFDYLASAKDPLEAFYKGEIAAEIARYSKEHEGCSPREDLAAFETKIEDPVSLRLGDTELFQDGLLVARAGRAADARADVAARPAEDRIRHRGLLPLD
jgi:gamma-glutamyltranspeptidase